MIDRREMLSRSGAVAALMAGAGLWPLTARAAWPAAAFESRTPAELARALGAQAPQESKELTLSGPEIAENGAVVPVSAACSAAGVRRLAFMVDKNPMPLAAMFEIGESLEPSVGTRLKLGQSSTVYAIALLADGRVLFAQKDIKVTLGGCGG